ncbi:hypothetical protein [Methylocystis parvus]|uniref:Uncharacterized protein n=1 Tax=Methylocystis parvus TaxID=134 RepID=A0A6B8MAT7_9HYPH|nr:hypothetical protein [Methylocystis parvus]QGM98689.1 hypothetical protein F7D14_15185 [Methylocystis parvus]WBK00962.1 hypothetical protein MMG94_04380 [Methylocystis parvus OBBP]
MQSGTNPSFDAMQALRVIVKLEDTPDADSAYLRRLVVADAKLHIEAATAENASEESQADA